MKTLLLLGAIGATAGGLWLRDTNLKAAEKAHAHQAAMLAEMQAAERAAALRAAPQPGRAVSYDPATRRYVEHAADVGAQQSRGGGGYGPVATPAPSSGDTVRKNLGLKGTALDQPASDASRRGR